MPTKKNTTLNTDALMRKAESVQQGLDLYSNLQRVTGTLSEVVIDFYAMAPNRRDSENPQMTHLQRIIIPYEVAKNLGRVISEIVEEFPKHEDAVITASKEEGLE